MKYLKLYESFYEPEYSCVNLTRDEFRELTDKDETLTKRIRYFNTSDVSSWYDVNPKFTVMFADELIIGICKIDDYENEPQDFTISYFSIDRDFRNRKLTRLMIDTLFDFISDGNYTLNSSSWTHPGMTKLKPLLDKIAEERGIKWITNDRKMDGEWMYNDDFINRNEMTDDELNKFGKNKKSTNFSFLKKLGKN